MNKTNKIYAYISRALVSGFAIALVFSTNISLLSNHAVAATGGVEAGNIDEEVLWLARAVYSETKFADEQALIAWVIRNRVESASYPDTYKEVVLERGQFSGMHPTDKQYSINVTLGYGDTSTAWDSALSIARAVYFADPILRPIPAGVMHFYSPISVINTPSWAKDIKPTHIVRDRKTNSIRFAFFSGIN